jgi:hypothetical protein
MDFSEMPEEAARISTDSLDRRDRRAAGQPPYGARAGIQAATGSGPTAQATNGSAIAGAGKVHVKTVNGHRQFNFGTGGIVSILLAGAVLGSGATVAATRRPGTPVTVGEAVGKWEHGGAHVLTGGVSADEGPIIMTVSRGGVFLFRAATSMSLGAGPGMDERIRCSGRVAAQGDSLAFTVTSGACQDFTASLSADRKMMTLADPAAEGQKEITLSRSG